MVIMSKDFLEIELNTSIEIKDCYHEWAEAFCISEDFKSIVPNGKVCIICGETNGNVI